MTTTKAETVPLNSAGSPSWYVRGEPTKAPYPYPGGKSRVAGIVWERFGNVDNYLESFFGSGAMLLNRPAEHFANGYRVETCNDVNHFIVNFWRAVREAPAAVAEYADWPVTEADLHARHEWLMRSETSVAHRELMAKDPTAFDARIAGWWVWGACAWIGGAWCSGAGDMQAKRPSFSFNNLGPGVRRDHESENAKDAAAGSVDWKQIPILSRGLGDGVNGLGRPQLADAYDIGRGVNSGGKIGIGQFGWGVNANGMAGTCAARSEWLTAWMTRLSDRLRLVRTLYGDFRRIGDSNSTLTRLGTTGIFLDPPYPLKRKDTGKKSRSNKLYASDKQDDLEQLRDDCLAYCRKHGGDPLIRIALCCYEGDGYEGLEAEGWEAVEWEASGGYGNQAGAKAVNAKRERIYFSPACLRPSNVTPSLF